MPYLSSSLDKIIKYYQIVYDLARENGMYTTGTIFQQPKRLANIYNLTRDANGHDIFLHIIL